MAPRRTTATATAAPPVADTGADKPEYRVEALAKGLRILSLFDEQRPTWRVTDSRQWALKTSMPIFSMSGFPLSCSSFSTASSTGSPWQSHPARRGTE